MHIHSNMFRNIINRNIAEKVKKGELTTTDAYIFQMLMGFDNSVRISARFVAENFGVSLRQAEETLRKLKKQMLIVPVGKVVNRTSALDLGPYFTPDLELLKLGNFQGGEAKFFITENNYVTAKFTKNSKKG